MSRVYVRILRAVPRTLDAAAMARYVDVAFFRSARAAARRFHVHA